MISGPCSSGSSPGDFLRTWRKPSENTAQWIPRHTRIGAALFLNDYDDGPEVKHRALMVHNPNAAVPLPCDPWSGIPEFSCQSGRWRWSDLAEQNELNRNGPSIWDVIRPGSEWLTDPAKFDREVRNCLREFAEKRKPR
jgi:hypothetical protein